MKNIIRETDSHNAALKARETEEARIRLKRLHQKDKVSEKSSRGKRRGREYEEETKQERKRRREESGEDDDGKRGRDKKHRVTGSRPSKEERPSRKYREAGRLSPPPDLSSEEKVRLERKSGHQRKHRRDRSRSRSKNRSSRKSEARKYRHRSHSQSPNRGAEPLKSHHRNNRSITPDSSPGQKPSRPHRPNRKPVSPPPAEADNEKDIDSDPLEAIVGPAPPPPVNRKIKFRGRGTFSSSTAIDSHFSETYDPSVDVRPNSDSEEDWDQAIEAFRDMQKWKQQGAERLKAAGFTDEEVKKWEKGGIERTEADVKWNLKGEGREWDRGKVVQDDGSVKTGAEWGRLKGT